MSSFLIQDHVFLRHFMRLHANALLLAGSFDVQLRLGKGLGALAGSEDAFFRAAFEELGIGDALRDATPESAATRQFGLLMEEAACAGYPACIAVICEADWLFLECASSPQSSSGVSGLSAAWLKLFAGVEARAYVDFARTQIDAMEGSSAEQARDFSRRAVVLEKEFFDEHLPR